MWPTQPVAAPTAGWFTDPSSPHHLRWWDGSGWTEHTMPAPEAQPTPIDAWTPPVQAQDSAPLRRERRRDRGREPQPVAASPVPVAPVTPGPAGDAPYVPFSQQYSPMRALTPVRLPGSPNTVPVWLLALLPLIIAATELGIYFSGVAPSATLSVTLSLAVYVVILTLALADRAVLKRRNLKPASGLWLLLLPPLVYLIARRVALKKMGVRSNAPGNVFVLSWLASIALVVFALFPVLYSSATSMQVRGFESQAAAQLEATSSTPWVVACPDDAPVLKPGANFSCTASDSTGRKATFTVDVGAQLQLVIRQDSISAA